MQGTSAGIPSADDDLEIIIEAVSAIQVSQPNSTAAAIHEKLQMEGRQYTLSQVRKACSKAKKRGFSAPASTTHAAESSAPAPDQAPAEDRSALVLEHNLGLMEDVVRCERRYHREAGLPWPTTGSEGEPPEVVVLAFERAMRGFSQDEARGWSSSCARRLA